MSDQNTAAKKATFLDKPCPYDGATVWLVDSARVYGEKAPDYGKMYVCSNFPRCDAYVGCHRGTKKPLGRLADKELRRAKQAAHRAFDPLWIFKSEREGCSKKTARISGYKWLADQLGIEERKCHIGWFDKETCWKVVAICRPHLLRCGMVLGRNDARDA